MEGKLPERVIFTSDLHLDIFDSQRIQLFMDFLHFTEQRGYVLYVLGDLFNFWVGDAQAQLSNMRPLIGAMKKLSQKNQFHFMHGNRDFLYSQFWQRKKQKVVYDGFVLRNFTTSIALYHGDAFCTSDTAYQKIRLWHRSRLIYNIARLLPPFFCMAIGRNLRKASQKTISHKNSRIMEVDFPYIDHSLKIASANIMICGHLHHRQVIRLKNKDTCLYFLPESKGMKIQYLEWEKGNLSFKHFGENDEH